ncbi:MAG TPA: hypothetical protein VGC08_15820 [Pedobacter sp.]
MSSIFRKMLFGDAAIREYATVTIDKQINEKVYLKCNKMLTDISRDHWLLCLSPIVFGVWITKGGQLTPADLKNNCKIYFTDRTTGINKAESDSTAELTLDFMNEINEKDGSLILLKLRKSRVYHINSIKARLLFSKYYKKPGVSFADLKALASAYSYPRKVRLISFKQDDYYNIFPMDLLGHIRQNNKYVFGLRHTNTALSKIIAAKKIVVSEVSFKHKETIYQLGSHHSAGPPPLALLPFKVISTENFGFYVPEWVDSYQEISIYKTMDLGSHMLLFGEVSDGDVLKESAGNLFHIHYLLYLHQKRKTIAYPAV